MNKSFEDRLRAVYENKTLYDILTYTDYAAVFVTIYSYVYLIAELLAKEPLDALRVTAVLVIPFVIVSIVRTLVRAPRPFEFVDFYENIKHKTGKSFPSRHVCSSFAMGGVLCFYHPFFGAGVLLLGCAIAASRVLRGLHFVRDVVVGGAVGAISAVVGMLIFFIL